MKIILFFTLCLFGFVGCASTDLGPSVEINEGDPYPEGPRVIKIHMDSWGAPGDRCDSYYGAYNPNLRICTVVFPGY